MKLLYKITLLFALTPVTFLSAQTLVGTAPTNKIAIVEKFTGVRCGPCATPVLHDILDANPGKVIAVEMHPSGTSLTAPWGADEDLSRTFVVPFTYKPYFGFSSISYPSAHISRRPWGGNRRVSTSSWPINSSVIFNEVSPMNVGLASTYNNVTKLLSVDVEIYYTQDVTATQGINLFLTQTGIITEQTGHGLGYRHRDTFRESLTAQWGDTIQQNTPMGTLVTMSFTYDNSITNYDMDSCHLVAGVWDFVETYTGNQCEANGGATTPLSIAELPAENAIQFYPNPASNRITFSGTVDRITVFDLFGKQVFTAQNSTNIDLSDLAAGQYLLHLEHSEFVQVEKVVLLR
jgi:hypothetical protein